jgi:hypothetical protein
MQEIYRYIPDVSRKIRISLLANTGCNGSRYARGWGLRGEGNVTCALRWLKELWFGTIPRLKHFVRQACVSLQCSLLLQKHLLGRFRLGAGR